MVNRKKIPHLLCILDGWGYRKETADNAVALAHTPVFDALWANCPRGLLRAGEAAVGLPVGQIGNSEVGHMNLGAGRVVLQDLPRIDHAIATGHLARHHLLVELAQKLLANGGTAHVLGLASPGGVHAHEGHLLALVEILRGLGVPVVVHAWTDGRDVPPTQAASTLPAFAARVAATGATLGTVCGRYYAMDRDHRWERTERAYNLLVDGVGEAATDVPSLLAAQHGAGINDEFVVPHALPSYRGMQDGDALICGNFRADRVRQILAALLLPDFAGFARTRRPQLASAIGMFDYSDELKPVLQTLFPPKRVDQSLGEVLAQAGKTQLRLAETEKYPHVTFFFNGGEETVFAGEDRQMVPSPKVATYDLQPEMSAATVTAEAVAAINSGKYDFILLNFANPDMVGHTGMLDAAIAACETVDAALGQVLNALQAQQGVALVTADHGNCELMRDPTTGGPHTAHTLNPVPIMLVGGAKEIKSLRHGVLADVAPTLLELMGVAPPAAMTGQSLLVR